MKGADVLLGDRQRIANAFGVEHAVSVVDQSGSAPFDGGLGFGAVEGFTAGAAVA